MGYCIATRRTDDNGNWYYDRLDDGDFATPELAAQWADFIGLELDREIVPTDQPRMTDPTYAEVCRRADRNV